MPDPRLIRMVDQAAGDGVTEKLLDDLMTWPPDPDAFGAVVHTFLRLADRETVRVIAFVALRLVSRDPDFRPAAEAAVDHLRPASYPSLVEGAKLLRGDDAEWWSSVIVRDAGIGDGLGRLLQDHGHLLMERRREEVIRHLTEPEKGPGGNRVDLFAAALSVLGRHPVLEAIWTRWIDDGLFDHGRADPLHGARILADCLQAVIDRSGPAGPILLRTAVDHWVGLVQSGDPVECRRVAADVVEILDGYVVGDPVSAAVPLIGSHVAPALVRAGVPEAATLEVAVRTALEQHGTPEETAAVRELWNEVVAIEQAMPSLPWEPNVIWR